MPPYHCPLDVECLVIERLCGYIVNLFFLVSS